MKQTAYFSFHFLTYLTMAIMLIPNKVSPELPVKQASSKVEIKVASLDKTGKVDFKEELLLRY